jgi:TyrR family helix-turn-helix protein
MVTSGSFRQDLLFRLDVLQLNLPPLRERTEDILPLAQVFLARACDQTGRSRARLSQSATVALATNPWLGNVRQLQNVIFRAVTLSEAPVIDAADLELAVTGAAADTGLLEEVGSLEEAVSSFERGLLQRLFLQYPSSRKLAERLQTSHSAIAIRLRKYGIKV